MAKQKVASWYWNITAMLTPVVLFVTLLWMYYSQEIQSYYSQANAVAKQISANNNQLAPLDAHMTSLQEQLGFGTAAPSAFTLPAGVQLPTADRSVGGEERNLGPEQRSMILNHLINAENSYYGDGQGMVRDYAVRRAWISNLEDAVTQYLAFKAGQQYTLPTGDEALTRPLTLEGSVYVPDTESTEWTGARRGAAPADPSMPRRLTLETVYRRQFSLLRDLFNANQGEYGLLYSQVSGDTAVTTSTGARIAVGTKGENDALARFVAAMQRAEAGMTLQSDESARRLAAIQQSLADISGQIARNRSQRLENFVLAAAGRVSTLQAEFETERAMHQGDAQRFDVLLRGLPRIKDPQNLAQTDPDGEVTYSDFQRGVCHINLGAVDGVKAGQRFEVWRTHGRERDQLIGVVEIVRTLSAHYSLVTVLSLVDSRQHVRQGDKLQSLLWHDGRFLTVALHGDFEPPNQAYSKERLSEILRQMGCRVVDRVQPGVDLVILGSNLFSDEWYREARNDLRFTTVREDAVRLYVDPR